MTVERGLKTLQDMVIPSALKAADEFQKTYGTFPIIEKILPIIETKAKAV